MNAAALALLAAGLTDYDTGNGWFLGHDGAEPCFSIRGGSGYFRFKPSVGYPEFSGNVLGASETGTDSGTLSGFSSTVNVTWDYQRTGNIVTLKLSGGAATGASNAAQMVYSTLAESLRPSGNRFCMCYEVIDNGFSLVGAATVTSSGTIAFERTRITSGAPGVEGVVMTNFQNTSGGTKGLGAGLEITYAL